MNDICILSFTCLIIFEQQNPNHFFSFSWKLHRFSDVLSSNSGIQSTGVCVRVCIYNTALPFIWVLPFRIFRDESLTFEYIYYKLLYDSSSLPVDAKVLRIPWPLHGIEREWTDTWWHASIPRCVGMALIVRSLSLSLTCSFSVCLCLSFLRLTFIYRISAILSMPLFHATLSLSLCLLHTPASCRPL